MADHNSAVAGLDRQAAELGPGGVLAPEPDAEGYRRRMERRKEVQQQRVGERNLEQGLVLVFTGDGKGKTTAALGLVLRTLGHGERVAVVQFIKGGWQPGEAKALEIFGDALVWQSLGEGFTWETQNRDRDRQLVQEAWQQSLLHLADGQRKLVVLDEINVALKLGYLELDQVLGGLDRRPELTHVALTGRGAPPALLERADLVLVVHAPDTEDVTLEPSVDNSYITVYNKVDLDPAPPIGKDIYLSCATKTGLSQLKEHIYSQVINMVSLGVDGVVLSNARHKDVFLRLTDQLTVCGRAIESQAGPEYLASDLRLALDILGEISGRTTPDDILNQIFAGFCVGK